MDYLAGFQHEGDQTVFDDLIGSAGGLHGHKYVLDTGDLKRGTLLGKITSGGKVIQSLSGASDGSQNPFGILAHDADASGGDVEVMVYIRGNFNENRVIFGTAHTADSTRDALRDLGIILEKPVKRYP